MRRVALHHSGKVTLAVFAVGAILSTHMPAGLPKIITAYSTVALALLCFFSPVIVAFRNRRRTPHAPLDYNAHAIPTAAPRVTTPAPAAEPAMLSSDDLIVISTPTPQGYAVEVMDRDGTVHTFNVDTAHLTTPPHTPPATTV